MIRNKPKFMTSSHTSWKIKEPAGVRHFSGSKIQVAVY